MEQQPGTMKIYKVIITVIIVVLATFSLTTYAMYQYFVVGQLWGMEYQAASTESGVDIDDILDDYRAVIDKYYIGEIDERKLIEGAIKGYVEGLEDPYTEYITEEEMEEYLEEVVGNFVGVGIYMIDNTEYDRIQIVAPIPGGPAEEAGILPGDLIISVNGEDLTASDIDIAPNKIKGEEGTTVTIELLRGTETITVDLVRELVKVSPVESKIIDENIGYISFISFDGETAEDFKMKYEELQTQGITSLIIDLRDNGGGIVDEALQILDYMTPKGEVLLYEVDKNGNEEISKSANDPIINVPIVILTNENTASSSEIVVGAMKDLELATIVGETTFGKGVIQQILTLRDGSGMKVTSAEYLTPDRNKINEIGIEPHEKIEIPEELKSQLVIEDAQDTQLQKAIEILKK